MILGEYWRPEKNRPDRDGTHRKAFDRNRKIIYATQSFCAICGRPVDFDIKPPDPMAPSIDHIVPIAKGGHPSDLANLQLAHLGCNRKKGTRIKDPVDMKQPVSNRALNLSADWKTF